MTDPTHDHDDRYYTESESQQLFRARADPVPWEDLDLAGMPAFAPRPTKTYFVDEGGQGDHTTISAAIAAAVAAGATRGNVYLVSVAAGTFTENVTVPLGVAVVCAGPYATRINGTLTVHNGGVFGNAWIAPPDNTSDFGWHLVFDGTTADRMQIFNCYGRNWNSRNGVVAAVKASGNTNINGYITNCYLYARNPNTGASAKSVNVWLVPGSTPYPEFSSCVFKNSTPGGVAAMELVWNQATGGGSAAIQASVWQMFNHAGPVALRNENAGTNGATLECWYTNWTHNTSPAVIDVNAGAQLGDVVFPSALLRRADSRQGYFLQGTQIISSAGVLSNLQVPYGLLTGRPTTLAGYGITDAAPLAQTHPPFLANKDYGSPWATLVTTTTTAIDRARATPFLLTAARTLTRMTVEVTTAGAAGALVRLGLYADDGNGRPGALVLDAGTVNGETIGIKTVTVAQNLTPGLYWMSVSGEGATCGVRAINGNAPFIEQSASSLSIAHIAVTVAGPLANPFISAGVSGVAARMLLRFG